MPNRFKAINVSLGSTKNKPVDAEVSSMQGRKGDPGPYFTPSVDTEGNISWENNGGLLNPETRNIKGPTGNSGVYYGDTEPTDPDVDVWIDPEGTPTGLTAEDIGYDDQETYSDGTVGKEIQSLSRASIITDTLSGSIVAFSDGTDGLSVKSISVDIKPVQNLNDYANPWPPGGGANIFDVRSWATLPNNDKYYTINDDESITIITNDVGGLQGRFIDVSPNEEYSILSTFANNVRIFDSGSQTVLQSKAGTFTAPTDGKIAIKFYASTYPTTGYFILTKGSNIPTSWTPYSNICPISGRTGLTVTRVGKNLLPLGVNSERNGIIYTVQNNGEVVVTGAATGNSFWGAQFTIPPGVYILSGCPAGGGLSNYRVEVRDRVGGNVVNNIVDSGSGTQFTLSEALTAFVSIRIANGYEAPTGGLKISPMLRSAIFSDATFEPYSGSSIAVQFGDEAGTVYAGSLDVTAGILTVSGRIVDLGDLTWNYYADAALPYFYAELTPPPSAITSTTVAAALCSAYPVVAWAERRDKACAVFYSRANGVNILDSAYTDVAAFKTAMAGVQLVYELADKPTYQLTPQEISTLPGANSIWSDAGDTEVSYIVDLKLYIDKKIKEIQSS